MSIFKYFKKKKEEKSLQEFIKVSISNIVCDNYYEILESKKYIKNKEEEEFVSNMDIYSYGVIKHSFNNFDVRKLNLLTNCGRIQFLDKEENLITMFPKDVDDCYDMLKNYFRVEIIENVAIVFQGLEDVLTMDLNKNQEIQPYLTYDLEELKKIIVDIAIEILKSRSYVDFETFDTFYFDKFIYELPYEINIQNAMEYGLIAYKDKHNKNYLISEQFYVDDNTELKLAKYLNKIIR